MPLIKKTLIGDRFGELVTIAILDPYIEPSGHRREKIRVRCSCNKEFDVCTLYLKRDKRTSCSSCTRYAKAKYKVGQTWDRLTIEGFQTDGKHRIAICKCSCNNSYSIRASLLSINSTNSCGCKPHSGFKGIGQMSGTYFGHIKHGAKKRNLEFNVTKEYVWNLFLEQKGMCAISGIEIIFPRYPDKEETTASLDRKDNSKGYIEGNLHWVHKEINRARLDLSLERFIELCKKVTVHQESINKC